MDRLLNVLMWGTVMGLIMTTACASLYFTYSGAIQLFGGEGGRSAVGLTLGPMLALAAYLLCRHGNDLLDR